MYGYNKLSTKSIELEMVLGSPASCLTYRLYLHGRVVVGCSGAEVYGML